MSNGVNPSVLGNSHTNRRPRAYGQDSRGRSRRSPRTALRADDAAIVSAAMPKIVVNGALLGWGWRQSLPYVRAERDTRFTMAQDLAQGIPAYVERHAASGAYVVVR